MSAPRASLADRLRRRLPAGAGTALFLLGLACLVMGAKLWLIDHAGSGLPVLDQIDAEGEVILRPWLEGELGWRHFWHPHNEHRVVLTKLLALGLVQLNGQWDTTLEQLVGAGLHALLLPYLLLVLRPLLPNRRAWWLLAAVSTALWVLPLNWENTLIGFQTQFYFVLWLAVLQLHGVLGATRFSWRWWGGQLCGFLALGAMSSGAVASAAVGMVTGLELIRTRRVSALQLASLLVSLLWIGLGWWGRYHFAGHDALRAQSAGEFLSQTVRLFAWPYGLVAIGFAWWLVSVPPRVVLAVRQSERSPSERLYLGLVTWFTLILLATAFFRGNGEVWASRYVDQLNLGLVLQGVALALIRPPRVRWTVLGLWTAGLVVVFTGLTRTTWTRELAQRGALMARQEAHVRTFLATDDPQLLLDAPVTELPLQWPEVIIDRWSHPSIQTIMPAAVRRPVPVAPAPELDASDLPAPPYPVLARSPLVNGSAAWTWRSAPQSADTLPVLRFRFTGDLGSPGSGLGLRIVSATGAVDVHPDGPAPGRWRTLNVIRPAGEWWIEMSDIDDHAWFALTAPVELGWGSWLAEKTVKHHGWWSAAGIALVLGGLLLARKPGETAPTGRSTEPR